MSVHLRLEELNIITPVLLGVVHREVRVLQQCVRVHAVVRISGDTDAAGDVQIVLVDRMGRGKRRQYFFGTDVCILWMRYVREQDDEFIAPLPADRVAAAHARPQSIRDGLQQAVADRMAQGIVNVLETIHVQKKQCQLALATAGQRYCLFQSVAQQYPVGQIGQTVVLGQIGHPERQRPRRRHVMKHHDGAGHRAAPVMDRSCGILDRGFDSVPPDQDAVWCERRRSCFAQSPAS